MGDIRRLSSMDETELMTEARDLGAPYELVVRETRRWPKKIVPKAFPSSSTLFMDETTVNRGVFVRVPSKGTSSFMVEPGIWYFDVDDTEDGTRAAVTSSLMSHYFIHDLGPKAELVDFVSDHVPGALLQVYEEEAAIGR